MPASDVLMGRANRRFQAQRTRIAFADNSIEKLLGIIESSNRRLQQLLQAIDDVSAVLKTSDGTNNRHLLSASVLAYSEHAKKTSTAKRKFRAELSTHS